MVDSLHSPLTFFVPHSDMSPNIILRKNCPTESNADFVETVEGHFFEKQMTYPFENSNHDFLISYNISSWQFFLKIATLLDVFVFEEYY